MELPILYSVDNGIASITLNRPNAANAQNTDMLYALNDAFDRAAQDDCVSVIVLGANGRHFSSGHDLREVDSMDKLYQKLGAYRRVGVWSGELSDGAEPLMAREKEVFLEFTSRWRRLPKPVISAVQGSCIAGGLMLVWPTDIIVAGKSAVFQDNTVGMGIPGVEFFAHVHQLGPRKAREVLFTGRPLTAEEALGCGMINKVVEDGSELIEAMAIARVIAEKPLFALKLTKEVILNAESAMGLDQAVSSGFAYHQLAHSHCMQKYGLVVDPTSAIKSGNDKSGADL